MNLNRPETIEAYLKGQLSPDERAAFETQLNQDPLFKSEMELQKDIVSSIKEYRKNQLKQRLDNIEIGSSISQFAAAKIASSLIIASVIGVGAFFYFSSDEAERTLAEKVETKEVVVEPKIAAPSSITEELAIKENNELPSESLTSKVEKESSVSNEQEVTPLVVSPNVTSKFEENQVVLKDSGLEHTVKPIPSIAERLADVEVINEDNRSKELKYKYLNKKLYLYGDFSSAPYELLEFNLSTRTLFLFHNDNYYQLNENQKTITPLVAIKDPAITKELDTSRNKQ